MSLFNIVTPSLGPSPLTQEANGILLHAKVQAMPHLPMGPFARAAQGHIVAVDAEGMLVSRDEGVSWETLAEKPLGPDVTLSGERGLICTKNGVLVLAGEDRAHAHWTWDADARDATDATIPTLAARSLDGGRTWQDVRTLHTGWNGAIRDMKQLSSGRVIFTTMVMLHHPGRHGVFTFASDDDGATWMASNVIDFGGNGHHDGAKESTIVELADSTLLMYIRTNWGQFWRAESTDGGMHWHPLGPAGVDAPSAPGLLFRHRNGKLGLVWNRALPEDGRSVVLQGGDRQWSATPTSNFREELSLALSDDEARHWTVPVVLARKADTWLAYPYLFEVEPGVWWLTTMQGEVRLRFREADFAG